MVNVTCPDEAAIGELYECEIKVIREWKNAILTFLPENNNYNVSIDLNSLFDFFLKK